MKSYNTPTLLTPNDWHDFFKSYGQYSAHLPLISVQIQDQFTPEIDQIRQLCFPAKKLANRAKDLFDDKSKHIVVMLDHDIAAYGRLTPGPNAVFEDWTHGQANIPVGEQVIDLGRCLVSPQYRGQGLLELVVIAALIYAKEAHFKFMVGIVNPAEAVGTIALKYGFVNSGGLVPIYAGGMDELNILCQPMVCDLEKSHNLWHDRIEQQLAFLASKGYRL